MATEILTLNNRAFFTQNISLLGESFTITLKYNSTDKRWRFSLSTVAGTLIVGKPLAINSSPTKPYQFIELKGGNFWCLRKKNTEEPIKFDNLGFDKDYGLFFLTTEEEESLGL